MHFQRERAQCSRAWRRIVWMPLGTSHSFTIFCLQRTHRTAELAVVKEHNRRGDAELRKAERMFALITTVAALRTHVQSATHVD